MGGVTFDTLETSPTPDVLTGYKTWEQVSGYFDGDGSLHIRIGIYTLNLEVSWSDEDKELLEHIKAFLEANGIGARLSETWTDGRRYFELSVMESGNLIELLRQMLPRVDKKWSQVKAGIDYLENLITGDELVGIMNEAVAGSKRRTSVRLADIPYTRDVGLRVSKSSQRWRKRCLTLNQMKLMRDDRAKLGLSYSELGTKYGVSPSTAYEVITKYLLEDDFSS